MTPEHEAIAREAASKCHILAHDKFKGSEPLYTFEEIISDAIASAMRLIDDGDPNEPNFDYRSALSPEHEAIVQSAALALNHPMVDPSEIVRDAIASAVTIERNIALEYGKECDRTLQAQSEDTARLDKLEGIHLESTWNRIFRESVSLKITIREAIDAAPKEPDPNERPHLIEDGFDS